MRRLFCFHDDLEMFFVVLGDVHEVLERLSSIVSDECTREIQQIRFARRAPHGDKLVFWKKRFFSTSRLR
jgi:hypothetical protein